MSLPGVIFARPPSTCSQCGKEAECRPYGPGGASICFACGQLDPKGTERRMAAFLFGEPEADESNSSEGQVKP